MKLTWGPLDLTNYPYSILFGSDFGAPQNVTEALAFLLQDGEVELTDRTSNRTIQFSVLVEGVDLLDCAQNEAALVLEADKPLNTLTLDPEDFGPPTVYETFRAQVAHARDDDGEMARLRVYTVTVKAAPAARSAEETVTAALAATGTTTTLVDNGSATTNWTGAVDGVVTAPSVVSGAVGITTSSLSGVHTVSLTRTASITTSATPYLMIDWQGASFGDPTLSAYADGVRLEQVGQTVSSTSGFTRTWFRATASSIAVLRLDSTSNDGGYVGTFPRTLMVDNINRTDVKPTLGTSRQLLRSIDVIGSARAQGSLAIEHATSSLGDVLAYFFPDGAFGQNAYSPPLRQYRVSGGTASADAALVSGIVEFIVSGFTTATVTFDIPLRNLIAGMHLFQARMALTGGSSTVSWTATTRVNGTTVGPTLSGSRALSVTTGGYVIYTLDRLDLPTTDVDTASSTAVVRVTLTATGGSGIALTLDEAWLFNTTIGQHLQIPCGSAAPASGGSAKRVFIEPATLASPRPTIRIGHASDRSDSFYPSDVASWQFPQFVPPRVNVLTVTTNALDASVSLRHFPRWHTHAAS